MTNREKFAEKILDIACSGGRLAVNKATLEPIACNSLECRDCLFYTECCKGARKKWANSEDTRYRLKPLTREQKLLE